MTRNPAKKALDRMQRIRVIGANQLGMIEQRHRHLLAHRPEEIPLVGEVPVDCAARHAGGCGDALKRRSRDPMRGEFAPCRDENLLAGLLGLLLGSTHG